MKRRDESSSVGRCATVMESPPTGGIHGVQVCRFLHNYPIHERVVSRPSVSLPGAFGSSVALHRALLLQEVTFITGSSSFGGDLSFTYTL